MRLLFDIESNGLLESATKIHSLVLYDIDTNEMYSCADDQRFLSLQKGFSLLADAELLIGHNIIKFDLPLLKKLHGLEFSAEIFDTLNASRLIYTDILERDISLHAIPKPLYGKHSLASWGERLKFPKGDFGEVTDCWKKWTLPMQYYCQNDVELNVKLYRKIMEKNYSKKALDLEMEFQKIIFEQEQNGVSFDRPAAMKMYYQLRKDADKFKADLQEMVGPIVKETIFIPKRDNQTKGYKKDVPFVKRTSTPFNPGSRVQIADFLTKKYWWTPREFTPTKRPKLSSDILEALPYPEAPIMAKYLTANKLLGQLGDGDKAWLKAEKDGRIYGSVITNGACTGRCTHNNPNLAQIPSVGHYMGEECRSLFGPLPGDVLVGCDASGLELRMLAHYLHKYDGGDYVEGILSGDIHTKNQTAAELPTRSIAKRFIYALNYGGGDLLLGSIIDPEATPEIQRRKGTRARMLFYRKIPAFEQLKRDVEFTARKRGHLIGLDGRKLVIREDYRALNTLLQGAGAVVMKQSNINMRRAFDEHHLTVRKVLDVHDEVQLSVQERISSIVGELAVKGIIKAGEDFNLSCPLDGEYKIGNNWAETH